MFTGYDNLNDYDDDGEYDDVGENEDDRYSDPCMTGNVWLLGR